MMDPGQDMPQVREWFETLLPDPSDPLQSLIRALHSVVLGNEWPQVLEVRAFGSADTFPALREAFGEISGSGEWPVSFLDGSPAPGGGIAGLQLHLVAGVAVETIRLEGEVVGRAFEDEGARYCVLGGVGPYDPLAHPARQTTNTLLRMEEALEERGMGLKDLVRTWFYLDHILGWYDEFNAARTGIYRDRGVLEGYVPASTGIGGRNGRGTAVLASALAMQVKDPGQRVEEVPSPLQCSAGSYGSSFSRAAEWSGPGFQRLFVSGTASIDPRGVTAHPGDVESQVRLTLNVVSAILESRGLGLEDLVRGHAYFKDAGSVPALKPLLEEEGVPMARVLMSRNAVCREDLLFELELEAARGRRLHG